MMIGDLVQDGVVIGDLTQDVKEKYASRLVDHIGAVQAFGKELGLPDEQLAKHDESKWDEEEFVPYALYHIAANSPEEKKKVAPVFARAWLHHIHQNPHHWQHWIFPDAWAPAGGGLESGVMRMPERYALEMIADWHGSSRVYAGSWDISQWLHKNAARIALHSETVAFVRAKLVELGYEDAPTLGLAPVRGSDAQHLRQIVDKQTEIIARLQRGRSGRQNGDVPSLRQLRATNGGNQ